jgi:hypothetical protein
LCGCYSGFHPLFFLPIFFLLVQLHRASENKTALKAGKLTISIHE